MSIYFLTDNSFRFNFKFKLKCNKEGGRLNIPIGPKQTAADVIAEVVRKIATTNSEQFAHRMFGLATLDGALLGPAMPIVCLYKYFF